jgi:hypothetical protein
VRGEHLTLRTGEPDPQATLWSEKDFGEAEFVFDCRPSKPAEGKPLTPPAVIVRGVEVKLADTSAGNSQRYSVTVKGSKIVVKRGEKELQWVTLPADAKARAPFGLGDNGTGMELMNLYAREL